MKKVSTVGKRIAEALENKNMKSIDLANATGISKSGISQYMSEVFEPKYDYICKMANVLGVHELWLMGYDQKKEDPRLSLEDIREINHLSKDDMARIMDMSADEYDYFKDHAGELELGNTLLLCNTLDIGINYIKTGL